MVQRHIGLPDHVLAIVGLWRVGKKTQPDYGLEPNIVVPKNMVLHRAANPFGDLAGGQHDGSGHIGATPHGLVTVGAARLVLHKIWLYPLCIKR